MGKPQTLWQLLLCWLILLAAGHGLAEKTTRNNPFPIVLVHGFIGWGPDDFPDYHYWGGRDSIAADLQEAGYPTLTGVVGPVSSNWDRACELYAYIKGGQVDYGAAHAARYGHKRYGRTFPGLLPEWGETRDHQRVHLVGHSQGGQTIRLMTTLLANGDRAERKTDGSVSPLFSGNKPWVHSVVTLNTPHDGTTLAVMLKEESQFLMKSVLALAAYLTRRYPGVGSYDFKLDQWGISQRPDESDKQYRQRLQQNSIWQQNDISVWDLTPEGAIALNSRYPAVDSVYYFSWASDATFAGPFGEDRLPNSRMNPGLIIPAFYIGSFAELDPGYGIPPLDRSWWANDGIVNTRSMVAPQLGSLDILVPVEAGKEQNWRSGVWNYMGEFDGWDHLDVVGLQTSREYQPFYLALAELLASLPAVAQPATDILLDGIETGQVEQGNQATKGDSP